MIEMFKLSPSLEYQKTSEMQQAWPFQRVSKLLAACSCHIKKFFSADGPREGGHFHRIYLR